MAITLQGSTKNGFDFSYPSSGTGFSLPAIINNLGTTAYTSGSGNNQVNLSFVSLARAPSGTTETIDLDAGTLVDIYGRALTFTAVKLLIIRNLATTTITLTGDFMTQAAVGIAAGGRIIGAMGIEYWEHPQGGYPVTATTADQIIFTYTAETTYDLIILGVGTVP